MSGKKGGNSKDAIKHWTQQGEISNLDIPHDTLMGVGYCLGDCHICPDREKCANEMDMDADDC